MILPLLENEKRIAEETLRKVFQNCDPFSPMISDSVPIRVVLFPTDSYHLASKQFAALIKALDFEPKKAFYVSEIEQANPFSTGKHWLCDTPTFDEYTHLPTGVENAIYSVNGAWAILLSHELHGLLACNHTFWNKFKENYPNVNEDQVEFIRYWKEVEDDGTSVDWMPDFVRILRQ